MDLTQIGCPGRYFDYNKRDNVGIDTGLYLRTDSPYDLHRRLVDEGVIFVMDPKRTHLGLITSFKDDDGNVLYAIEVK